MIGCPSRWLANLSGGARAVNFERQGGRDPLLLIYGIGGELCAWADPSLRTHNRDPAWPALRSETGAS